jgi:Domain of unknown function (DUF4276)
MRELVLLLEEPSAKAFLQNLLPRILDASVVVRLIAFEGKQDLERQLTRRLRGYANPQARFLVMRDQDSAPDCKLIKERLLRMCDAAGRRSVSLVRIACRELESMYLADLNAVELALGLTGLVRHQQTQKFRQPDCLESPSHELSRLTKGAYQKVRSSRELGKHMSLKNDRSSSFKNLVVGLERLNRELTGIAAPR